MNKEVKMSVYPSTTPVHPGTAKVSIICRTKDTSVNRNIFFRFNNEIMSSLPNKKNLTWKNDFKTDFHGKLELYNISERHVGKWSCQCLDSGCKPATYNLKLEEIGQYQYT